MTSKRKIPAILPKLEWEIDKEYKFRIPFSVNGMEELQVLTTRPNSDELIWANSRGHKYSRFPYEIHLKDVIFGVMPRHSKNIIWVDNQKNLDSRLIQAFCFKGTSVNRYNYEKTYNPYSKYSSFQLNELACKRNIQVSLWRLVESYKRSGEWEEMRNTLKYINDVRCRTSLSGIWKILTHDLHYRDFIVPNPALSLAMHLPSKEELDGILSFNFLFTNSVQTERQTLTKWINPNLTKNYRQAINQYISDEEWDRDPILLEEDNPF
jgi:hypothetical protein